jgi:alpha-tubulin suppressor-like RCC1 family protein
VACGNFFTLALSADGIVYSWGLGNSGGLGQGERNVSYTPLPIKT